MLLWASLELSLGNHWKRTDPTKLHHQTPKKTEVFSESEQSFRSCTYSSIAVTLCMWLSLVSLCMLIKHYLPFAIVQKIRWSYTDNTLVPTNLYMYSYAHFPAHLHCQRGLHRCSEEDDSEHLGFAGHLVSVTSTQPSVKAAIEMHRWMSHPML